MPVAAVRKSGSGPSRHFAASQQFRRFRCEADIEQRAVFVRAVVSPAGAPLGHTPTGNRQTRTSGHGWVRAGHSTGHRILRQQRRYFLRRVRRKPGMVSHICIIRSDGFTASLPLLPVLAGTTSSKNLGSCPRRLVKHARHRLSDHPSPNCCSHTSDWHMYQSPIATTSTLQSLQKNFPTSRPELFI